MEIEECDMMITPEGYYGELMGYNPIVDEVIIKISGGATKSFGSRYVIALNEPIYVSIATEQQYEEVKKKIPNGCELRGEYDNSNGFFYMEPDLGFCKFIDSPSIPIPYRFVPYNRKKQWTAWLDYHAESDECETCGDSGVIVAWPNITFPCRACPEDTDSANNAQTEISEKTDNDPVSEKSYNKPRPWDDTWRTMLSTYVNGHHWGGYPVEPKQIGIEPDDDYSKAKTHEAVDSLIDYIDDLEQELEEVREERDELREKLQQIEKVINENKEEEYE